MRRALPDLRLMLVTDPRLMEPRGLIETTLAAVAGGVTIVQLRDKVADDSSLLGIAAELARRLAPTRVPLIINDRPSIARAIGAAGAHVGQSDGSAAEARAVLGPDAILGLSVTSADDIGTVDPTLVDYVGLGPIFASPTKADAAPALGVEAMRVIGARLPVPHVAIGGINVSNAAAIMTARASGVAVVSAIAAADDPLAAAAALRQAIDGARG